MKKSSKKSTPTTKVANTAENDISTQLTLGFKQLHTRLSAVTIIFIVWCVVFSTISINAYKESEDVRNKTIADLIEIQKSNETANAKTNELINTILEYAKDSPNTKSESTLP